MGIIDNIFGRKIEFNDKMNELIETVKGINWFSNCGKVYTKDLYFNYKLENENNTLKKLNQKRNYKEFVILENLFIAADRRKDLFLYRHHYKEHQYTYNKLMDRINKRFMNNINEINFVEIDSNYWNKFNINNRKKYTSIYGIFRITLAELFFDSYISNIPIFYNHIFEIYKDGHIVVGWEGKAIEKELWNEEPIKQTDGKIIIY